MFGNSTHGNLLGKGQLKEYQKIISTASRGDEIQNLGYEYRQSDR
jgi:hypothetical protein